MLRVLERLSPRAISSHLRTFADYLIYEFALFSSSSSNGNQQINKCVDSLNDLVWKCCIVPIDRLVLCLVSCTFINQVRLSQSSTAIIGIQSISHYVIMRPKVDTDSKPTYSQLNLSHVTNKWNKKEIKLKHKTQWAYKSVNGLESWDQSDIETD